MSEHCHCHSCGCGHEHEKNTWVRFGVAAVLFAAGLLVGSSAAKPGLLGAAYLLCGYDVLLRAGRNILKGRVFDENFLMSVASLGAFAIGEYPEGAAVMLFYQCGENLQERAAGASRRNIVKLLDLRPPFARVLENGSEIKKDPKQVQPGQEILVLPGEKIALDGVVVKGESGVDASALTGESRPVSARVGTLVWGGSVCVDGTLTVRVEKLYQDSAVAKILELTEHALQKKSDAEKFITRFARLYTPVVVGGAVLLAVLPPLLLADASFKTWLYRALVFLVASCPCALVLSVPLGFFGGIGGAAKHGVLIKGSAFLERLARIWTLAFDKTGTLTQGVFEVLSVRPAEGVTRQEVLRLAARAERYSNHPAAKAVLRTARQEDILADGECNAKEIAGEGICAHGEKEQILAGNARLMSRYHVSVPAAEGSCVFVAQNGVWKGTIVLGDRLKEGAASAVKTLQNGLMRDIVILSGDAPSAVRKTAGELGITQSFGGLLPADKVAKLESFIAQTPRGYATAFAGDGVNDAPVLARADLSVAMGGLGSDAAIEAADVVLMTDEIGKLVTAVRQARFTMKVIKQNMVFALAVKAVVLAAGALGCANLWEAVFADVGVSLLAVANALRPLYFKENMLQ
ncbi:MAG: heavy metal translocating P-type ATPase [Candidatus Avelusimicrobium sp.]|uniref:heavy metal translocating P-type ATPase n=1 Tax=Candidatus Avelusimicrobium sp. TaxID=3048833 RepID=UPI003F0B8986